MGKILDSWQSSATQTHITSILPDGCRDLICSQRRGKYPEWFISDLQSGSNNSRMESGDYMAGFRLPPGTVINETDLLQTLGKMDPDTAKITAILQDHIHQCPDVTSILTHLARCRGTAAKAAGDLNIHPRKLHRLLAGATGRGAGFWLQLARARTAGREILGGGDHCRNRRRKRLC